MKDIVSKIIFVFFDITIIALSIYLAYILRSTFNTLETPLNSVNKIYILIPSIYYPYSNVCI